MDIFCWTVLRHLGKTDPELGLEQFADAADPAVAEVIDIIGLADAILNIAEIREAGDHIADRDARTEDGSHRH
jgi:hypothetical protein